MWLSDRLAHSEAMDSAGINRRGVANERVAVDGEPSGLVAMPSRGPVSEPGIEQFSPEAD